MSRAKRWTHNEILWLCDNWSDYDLRTLSDKLGRSIEAIKQQARALKLPKKPRVNAVPQERIEFIRDNVGKMSAKEMAAVIRCPVATVYTIARNNGIKFK